MGLAWTSEPIDVIPDFPRFQIVMLPLGVPLTTTISSAPSALQVLECDAVDDG